MEKTKERTISTNLVWRGQKEKGAFNVVTLSL
jgi:hypothetical protein